MLPRGPRTVPSSNSTASPTFAAAAAFSFCASFSQASRAARPFMKVTRLE
jgi:hypothetical protein